MLDMILLDILRYGLILRLRLYEWDNVVVLLRWDGIED